MNLSEFIYTNTKPLVMEGGASGHMHHIIDYDDLTLDNLKGIIYNLFGGRIEKMTEKIDGTNIQAGMNNAGEVIFIRNGGDLQSERGGMSLDDMVNKWAGKDKIQKTFVESGKVLAEVFAKLSPKFFNPNPETRRLLNCECMIEGTTNIIPYVSAKVNVHDIWVYTLVNGKWEHTDTTKDDLPKVEAAMAEIDGAQITPEVIVKVTEEGAKIRDSYFRDLNKLFKEAGLKNKNTINEYKQYRFSQWLDKNAAWVNGSADGVKFDVEAGISALYERYFHGTKTGAGALKNLKNMYSAQNLAWLEEHSKDAVQYATEPLDILFLKLGNDVIDLCTGFINDGGKTAMIDQLTKDLNQTVAEIQSDPNTKESSKTKLLNQLNRLASLDNKINHTEGIVFTYKGRLMKCTGSFAPLNQILGSLKYNR